MSTALLGKTPGGGQRLGGALKGLQLSQSLHQSPLIITYIKKYRMLAGQMALGEVSSTQPLRINCYIPYRNFGAATVLN